MNEDSKRTDTKQAARELWQQGIRSGDATIISLCYGYSEAETAAICDHLACRENGTESF